MDLGIISLALFLASTAAFSYLAYKLYKRGAEQWAQAGRVICVMLGFLMFLGGLLSENMITMIIGLVTAFASSSLFLTHYVRSEFRAKRFLEIIFSILSLGIIVYGYLATGSIILGLLTLFIAAMITVALMLSYLLPRIRAEVKH
ncbi:MAG: hypothetical protein QW341_00335 [Candidatus Bathyarchaeia archaeon]